jgi:hypothetical protein
MSEKTHYLVTDSYAKDQYGVAAIGVAFRGGRIVCGDIVEAPDLLAAELLAILRAVEITSRVRPKELPTVIYTDHQLACELANATTYRHGLQPLVHLLQDWLSALPNITVQLAPHEAVKSARIVARQTFKAWRCSFNEGVTWSPASIPGAVAA